MILHNKIFHLVRATGPLIDASLTADKLDTTASFLNTHNFALLNVYISLH